MIVKFHDLETRERFLELCQEERSDIRERLVPAMSLPHVTAHGLSDEQVQWLEDKVAPYGKAFPDVKFELM